MKNYITLHIIFIISFVFYHQFATMRNCSAFDGYYLANDLLTETDSSFTVTGGNIQLETVWFHYKQDYESTDRSMDFFPGILARIGITHRAELQLRWAGYIWDEYSSDSGNVSDKGGGQGGLSVKVYIHPGNNKAPEIAFILRYTLSGGLEYPWSKWRDPFFKFCMSHNNFKRISIHYNFGLTWNSETEFETEDPLFPDRRKYYYINYSSAFRFRVSDTLLMFTEIYGDIPYISKVGSKYGANLGLSFNFKKDSQLTLIGGMSLKEDDDNQYFGLSYVQSLSF